MIIQLAANFNSYQTRQFVMHSAHYNFSWTMWPALSLPDDL